uniref:NADH-ubiquinone oxidoreductase chain 4 n=2 Tax=decim group TaxID=254007 RepID=A0A3Q8GJF6_9HEMI|nr:NADH dehydrogenase subunit 4 [Magicicada septendecim]AWV83492.1 NADH dehydrogenase subunit 4 [Magicicada neotredecim]AWV83505.1 NADH dehydrogenase subunit 4 [Magicicada septendecim]QBM07972.1 NADH dehydrogenase subunit 4 [Magicicada septendecim]QBM07985.1 NADH dehydrogenase subunit 4 [Magicicada septendecim]QBM07998.1 NADH dehydrogenase subunit 4 [Magicicada septendecim]
MLKLILFSLFMIPLLFNMWLLSNMLILLMLFIILFSSKDLVVLSYNMYMDNISYGLIILTVWITFLMINSSPLYKYNNMNLFLFMVLLLMTLLILSFCSYNIMMFYIFFETSLIPTMIIIMGWGYQPERVSASYYLLFYTLFASFPMLISIMYMYSINMNNVMMLMSSNNKFIYLGMTLAFMVKVPLFMFHFWLPKAHVEAPVSGSMILAGILLKLGTYGLIRVMYIMPMMFANYSFIWISISLMGGIMISLSCMMQIDMKSMIAYSSVAHMSLVIGGIMTMNMWGMVGAYFMMIGHGLCSSALFCLANISYERSGSRSILINKGMLSFMPSMTLMWFLMSSSNISCPPTISLAGEIMILNSLMSWNSLCMIFLSLSSFLSACYSLYLYSHTQHGMIFSGCYSFNSGNVREFFLIMMHWVPLNLIILKLTLLM